MHLPKAVIISHAQLSTLPPQGKRYPPFKSPAPPSLTRRVRKIWGSSSGAIRGTSSKTAALTYVAEPKNQTISNRSRITEAEPPNRIDPNHIEPKPNHRSRTAEPSHIKPKSDRRTEPYQTEVCNVPNFQTNLNFLI
ncbi:hypothetical protein LXL04_026853 [Taraxacum kok-saghyz]